LKVDSQILDEVYKKPDFLFEVQWWQRSVKAVLPWCPRLLLPAALLAISNICGVVAEAIMGNVGNLANIIQTDPTKALGMALLLLLAVLLGTVLGLVSCSLWMVELTAVSRLLILGDDGKSLGESFSEVKKAGKHIFAVWLWGLLYLIVPTLILSFTMSLLLISKMNLSFVDTAVFFLPPFLALPLQLLALISLFLVVAYSMILMVISSEFSISAKDAAHLSAELFQKFLSEIMLMSVFLIVLDLLISSPFCLLSLFPQCASLMKNLAFGVSCQFWFAATSMISWPLSVMIFAEFLRPFVLKLKAKAD